jgi:hypothetical protein
LIALLTLAVGTATDSDASDLDSSSAPSTIEPAFAASAPIAVATLAHAEGSGTKRKWLSCAAGVLGAMVITSFAPIAGHATVAAAIVMCFQ